MRIKPLHIAGRLAALGAFAAVTASAGNVRAQSGTDCTTLPRPVIVVGSSAVQSFIAVVATALANEADPISIIYGKPGSCAGLEYIIPTGHTLFTGSAIYWDAAGTQQSCSFTGNTEIDIGISDVFPASCGLSVPNTMKEFRGPVQSMTFAVSTASSRKVMSGEAAYLTLGLGDDGDTPWGDHTKVFVRDQFSGTQQMIANAIGVPAASFKGTSTDGAGIIAALQASAGNQATADATLGILGMDAIRGNAAGDVIPLAYQHFGQTAGYYPSSSLGSNDMQNTRDGHYMIQGPVHMVTRVKSNQQPSNADAKVLIDYLTGATIPSTFDLIHLEAGKSIVPDCAMRVSRDSEAGPFVSYMPPISCECKFLFEATADVPSECTECQSNDDCTDSARPHCNYGYCEVQ